MNQHQFAKCNDGRPESKNVYWRDIKIGTKIEDKKTLFMAGNKVIYWHSSEAAEAQRYLKTISKFWVDEQLSAGLKGLDK